MARAVDGTKRKEHRKEILKAAKGYRGSRGTLHRTAKDAVAKAGVYAYRDRKVRKREFRRLWIARISAVCRSEEISYSKFIWGLKKCRIDLNRKVLAFLAATDEVAVRNIIRQVKKSVV